MKKISIIASLAIAGALSLSIVGCGSSNSGSTTTGPVVNSYLVYLPTAAQDGAGQLSKTGLKGVVYDDANKTTGKIQFTSFINGVVTVPSNAIIDSNANYIYDSGDKAIGFKLKGQAGNAITPLTTLAVENNITLPASLQGDPIAKLKDGDPTAYLAEQAIVKAVQANGYDASILEDLNVTENGAVETNSTDGNIANAIAIASPEALKIIKAAMADKDANVTTADIIESAEEGMLLQDAIEIVTENNITVEDVNTTKLKEKAENIKEHIDSQEAKLLVDGLTVGNTNVLLDANNSFDVTVNTTDKNITDFYNISFSAGITKAFTPIQNVGVSVQITDATNSNKSVSLVIQGATVSPNDANTSLVVTLPANSTVAVAQSGLPELESVIGASATATTTKDLTMKDLGLNVNTILGALGNDTKISDAVNVLNTYLSKPKSYDVTVSFTGVQGINVDTTSYIGKVTVTNTATASSSSEAASSSASSSSEAASSSASSSSEAASSSASSCTEAKDPFGNPTGSYVDENGNTCTPAG